jgi:hypothetical protein
MLGDLIPVMTGVAIAGRYLGHKIVTMTWIGDGGTSTGAFHEGLNFGAVQRAPFVLIVENNQWAYSTPVKSQVPIRDLADRARAYGIPSMIVDGNDIVAVYQTAKEAVERARAGEGPVLIEAKTMRMKGHAQHDPAEYVPKEMFEYWKARDPIARYEKYLTENKLWDAKKRAEIDARIERELNEDREFAENSPFPPPELAEQGVYCEGCHTIQAEWKRPKEEVMPPKSSIRAVYEVADFGGIKGDGAAAAANVSGPSVAAASGDGNGVQASKSGEKPGTNPAKAKAAEVAARVPFGRGPKDKAFRESHQSKSFGKDPQGKPFRKESPGKSFGHGPQGKPFGKEPQGKPFGNGPQRKRGRR